MQTAVLMFSQVLFLLSWRPGGSSNAHPQVLKALQHTSQQYLIDNSDHSYLNKHYICVFGVPVHAPHICCAWPFCDVNLAFCAGSSASLLSCGVATNITAPDIHNLLQWYLQETHTSFNLCLNTLQICDGTWPAACLLQAVADLPWIL